MTSATRRIRSSPLKLTAFCFGIFVLAITSAAEVRAQGGPLRIQTNELPPGFTGTAYSFTVAGAGGVTPYTWSASGLPTGWSMSSSGQITGIPTAVGSFTVTVTLRDATLATVNKGFPLVISAGALSVTTVSLGLGTVGQDYSEVLTATGGAPPYSWSIDFGSLPGGLTLFATGSISGTPRNDW